MLVLGPVIVTVLTFWNVARAWRTSRSAAAIILAWQAATATLLVWTVVNVVPRRGEVQPYLVVLSACALVLALVLVAHGRGRPVGRVLSFVTAAIWSAYAAYFLTVGLSRFA